MLGFYEIRKKAAVLRQPFMFVCGSKLRGSHTSDASKTTAEITAIAESTSGDNVADIHIRFAQQSLGGGKTAGIQITDDRLPGDLFKGVGKVGGADVVLLSQVFQRKWQGIVFF